MKQYQDTDYYVTETGEVWSKKYGDLRKLKPGKDKDGYLQVILMINGKRIKKFVHRLVGETFISNLENLKDINHLDGNKLNNNINNLQWCTHANNMKHGYQFGLINNKGEKNGWCGSNHKHFKPSTLEAFNLQQGITPKKIKKENLSYLIKLLKKLNIK